MVRRNARAAEFINCVITGHSRLKDGVASLAYVLVVSIKLALCFIDRDGRNKSGHDSHELNF